MEHQKNEWKELLDSEFKKKQGTNKAVISEIKKTFQVAKEIENCTLIYKGVD